MKQWAIYDNTGFIDRVYYGPETEAMIQPSEFESVIELGGTLTDRTAYVVSGQVKPKRVFPTALDKSQIVADGIDECVITNIPAGTTVKWPDGQTDEVTDGQTDEVTDGEVRFAVDLPGTYILKLTAVAYLDKEITIAAIPAA
jgi:hypothetical protein